MAEGESIILHVKDDFYSSQKYALNYVSKIIISVWNIPTIDILK